LLFDNLPLSIDLIVCQSFVTLVWALETFNMIVPKFFPVVYNGLSNSLVQLQRAWLVYEFHFLNCSYHHVFIGHEVQDFRQFRRQPIAFSIFQWRMVTLGGLSNILRKNIKIYRLRNWWNFFYMIIIMTNEGIPNIACIFQVVSEKKTFLGPHPSTFTFFFYIFENF
jgi:hypothetical protein